MKKLDNLVLDFLAQKKIAVVGVSDKRDTGCNLAYQKFKENGYQVYAVNPRISTYDGQACYADLKSIPEKVDAVFVLTSPRVTEQVVSNNV
jgi:predicted CoA-binding protein